MECHTPWNAKEGGATGVVQARVVLWVKPTSGIACRSIVPPAQPEQSAYLDEPENKGDGKGGVRAEVTVAGWARVVEGGRQEAWQRADGREVGRGGGLVVEGDWGAW